jgi:ABC-type multidrug transport system ATPase subunit
MIRARGLARRFGSRCAVDDVSLDVADGTLLALLGPNGAGKTTTVRMLCGLLAPSAGSAAVAGHDVAVDPAAVRARIGLVTDVPGLYEQMSPRAYLDFFGHLYGIDAATRASASTPCSRCSTWRRGTRTAWSPFRAACSRRWRWPAR